MKRLRTYKVLLYNIFCFYVSFVEIFYCNAKCILPRWSNKCQVSWSTIFKSTDTIHCGGHGFLYSRYDIKGCEVSRWTDPAPEGSHIIVVLKDLNFEGQFITLGKVTMPKVYTVCAFKSVLYGKWIQTVLFVTMGRPAAVLAPAAGGDWHTVFAKAKCSGLQFASGPSALAPGWEAPGTLLCQSHRKNKAVSVSILLPILISISF